MSSLRHRFAASRVAPAQTVEDFVGVKIDPERRRGRGAESNQSGRYEPLARALVDDGWGSARRPAAVQDHGAGGAAAQDHHHQRFARHLLRPLDQPLSRLRARLRLLLRAADPRLYGPLARPRFRDQAVRQAERGEAPREGAGEARLRAAHHGDRHQHRPLPADREALPHHARDARGARRRQPPGRHRHQVGAGAPRHRHPVADGRAQSLQGRALGHHARPQARPRHGAARRDAGAPARRAPPPLRGRRADHGHGGADHPGAQRIRDRAHPRRRRGRRRQARPATCCCACRSRSATSSRSSSSASIPTGRSTSCR